jgi:hypothetical protein
MTAQAHSSTDDVDIAGFDAPALRPPLGAASAASAPSPGSSDAADAFEGDPTEVNPRQGLATVEQPTPTEIDPSAPSPPAAPVRVISMKDHTEGQRPPPAHRVPLHVQLRTLAQVSGSHEVQPGLGHLAPPREPTQAPERRLRDIAVRVAIAVALGVAAALIIWFVAGR